MPSSISASSTSLYQRISESTSLLAVFVSHASGSLEAWIREHKKELITIGALTLAGAIIAPILIPFILNVMGFGAGGVAAGSLAAALHAIIGNVAAGSVFAALQAMGATGLIGAVGVLAGAGLGLAGGLVGVCMKKLFGFFGRSVETAQELVRRAILRYIGTISQTITLPNTGITRH
jgi:hypothetical protein